MVGRKGGKGGGVLGSCIRIKFEGMGMGMGRESGGCRALIAQFVFIERETLKRGYGRNVLHLQYLTF